MNNKTRASFVTGIGILGNDCASSNNESVTSMFGQSGEMERYCIKIKRRGSGRLDRWGEDGGSNTSLDISSESSSGSKASQLEGKAILREHAKGKSIERLRPWTKGWRFSLSISKSKCISSSSESDGYDVIIEDVEPAILEKQT